MDISDLSQGYLGGDMFSNAYKFAVEPSTMIGRNSLLQELVTDRVVLHYGCADHVELIEQKRRENTYLHDLLAAHARHLVGADINSEALARMGEIGIRDLYHPRDLPRDLKFDLLLAPDVIEHVPNVGEFLLDLASLQSDVVITTPNAFRLANRLRLRAEQVNSDHRYWFSPYTLAKTLVAAGFEIRSMWFTDLGARRQPLRTRLKRKYPLCRDGLAVLATPPASISREHT